MKCATIFCSTTTSCNSLPLHYASGRGAAEGGRGKGVLPLILLLAGTLAPGAWAQHPDLSGSWILKVDPATAADSAAQVDSAQPDSGAAQPGSDLRPIIRRGGKLKDQQQLMRLVGMAQPVTALRIVQTDSALTLTNADGFSYAVHPGQKKDSIQVGEEWVWVRARWQGRVLEIEYRPPGGGRIIETYLLADSKQYLRIEVVVEHDLLAQRLWRPRMYRREDATGS